MRSLWWILVSVVMLCLVGCGGSGATTTSGTVNKVTISPSPFSVKPGDHIQLTAVLDGGTAPITWQVNTPNGGSINQAGIYTAPMTSGSYEVQVSLTSDPSKFGKATAKVDSGYVVSITAPGGVVNVPYDGTLQLTAKVQGASSNDVTWTTTYGSISSTGLFTAPSTSGDAIVKAVSVTDPGKSTILTLHVVPPIAIVNASDVRTTIPKGYYDFKAMVNGVASNNVDWTATSGTISTAGHWIADDTFNGSVTVTATSKVDNTKSATATVTVVPNMNVRFTFQTLGDIVFALRPDKAPNTSANLVSLANAKFYDGILVHRYEVGFVVQWGDPLTKTLPLTDPSIGTGGPGYTIPFETNDLKHLHYSLAMARGGGMDTAGSQIYVCLADQPTLDGNYCVFGSVLSGTSVVDALRKGDKVVSARAELP